MRLSLDFSFTTIIYPASVNSEPLPAYEAEAYALQRQIHMHLKREFSDNHPIHPCINPTEYVKITPDPFQFPETSEANAS